MSELKIGDIVQLNSGGPLMTVDAIFEEQVNCVWFRDDELRDYPFAAAAVAPIGQHEEKGKYALVAAANMVDEARAKFRKGGK